MVSENLPFSVSGFSPESGLELWIPGGAALWPALPGSPGLSQEGDLLLLSKAIARGQPNVDIMTGNQTLFTLFPLGKSYFYRPKATQVLGWPLRASRDPCAVFGRLKLIFPNKKDLISP